MHNGYYFLTTKTGSPVDGINSAVPAVANVSASKASSSKIIDPKASFPKTVAPCPSESPTSAALLRHCFFGNFESGVHCSAFLSDLPRLQRYASLHGLDYRFLTSVKQCRSALLRHIILGDCHLIARQVNAEGCKHFCKDFLDHEDTFRSCIDILTSASSHSINTDKLLYICEALNIRDEFRQHDVRRQIMRALRRFFNTDAPRSIESLFKKFDTLSKATLLQYCTLHSVTVNTFTCTPKHLRESLIAHIAHGGCYSNIASLSSGAVDAISQQYLGCRYITDSFHCAQSDSDLNPRNRYLHQLLTEIRTKVARKPMAAILDSLGISYDADCTLSDLRNILTQHIKSLIMHTPDTTVPTPLTHNQEDLYLEDQLNKIRAAWPVPPSLETKNELIANFRHLTSKSELTTVTCASCAGQYRKKECTSYSPSDINLTPLSRSLQHSGNSEQGSSAASKSFTPLVDYPDTLLEPHGIVIQDGETKLILCNECRSCLCGGKVPPLSIANYLLLGVVPDVLKDLSIVEEAMISLCRAKSWIIRLKEGSTVLPNTQRGLKGHVIVFPQRPSAVAKILPPSVPELQAPICVIFVGSLPPSQEWLKKNAKPLSVRPARVRQALEWLVVHNPLYKDVEIDFELLDTLPKQFMLPVHVEHIPVGETDESLTAGYDPAIQSELSTTEMNFESVTIADVDPNASANELRLAAMRHFEKGKGHVALYHDPDPVNEFNHPALFPKIYPTLFPYGCGGFEEPMRTARLSMERQVKHYLSIHDTRFQEHSSFCFTAFNILQRRTLLLRTTLKTKRSSFNSLASKFSSISSEAIRSVSARLSAGGPVTSSNVEERNVLSLMQQVNVITSDVPGSASSLINMRNQMRGLMIEKGLPSFFVTINPADVYNPIVKFLAGEEIDVDDLMPDEVPNYWEQSILIAKNPVIAARFFNIYINAFISALLGYDPVKIKEGALGVVKAYYGCVEAQGRGTLHCHMLIWLEGGLNPNEIKAKALDPDKGAFRERMLHFLDDTISNSVPEDPDPSLSVPSGQFHPSSVRGVAEKNFVGNETLFNAARRKDMHHLVTSCQVHSHNPTCYKYCKDSIKECRFDLDASNVQTVSMFDPVTGEITIRCLDGLVNNFNATILEAVRCNMDIKFIGSGASAKAILYYITNYITKSQLSAHVAYAALARAVDKLGEVDTESDAQTLKAKKLLQKCAFSLISEQELSAQQVCTYLLKFDDHFTSHTYNNLYWTSFESHANRELPSPECYKSSTHSTDISELTDKVISDTEIEAIDPPIIPPFDVNQDSIDCGDGGDVEDGDVRITVENNGQITAHSSQVEDYLLRGSELDNLSLWDMIARCEKVTRPKSKDTDEDQFDSPDAMAVCEDSLLDTENQQTVCSSIEGESVVEIDVRSVLASKKRRRSYFDFGYQHPENPTHVLKIRAPVMRRVPVPIGPSIPRRDRDSEYERYCRLMLIFFKPWRTAISLREGHTTWSSAFDAFQSHCSPEFSSMMNNMQILHECRDSRDDHFAERSNNRRTRAQQLPGSAAADSVFEDDVLATADTEADVLQHMQSISQLHSINSAKSDADVISSLEFAESSGMFGHEPSEIDQLDTTSSCLEHVTDEVPAEESAWREDYEARRRKWKQKAIFVNKLGDTDTERAPPICDSSIQFMDQLPVSNPSCIEPGKSAPEPLVDIDTFLATYTPLLNTEQQRAFKIIAGHSIQQNTEPLRMYLGGAGGTGKSLVIHALQTFFDNAGQSRRFRLTSFTGVAAQNIHGMTLHSALCLMNQSKMKTNSKAHQELIAMWEGVDYLFIDEVSMLGCGFLCSISKALNKAKQNPAPFGGINVIFAGDFAQLGPVVDTKLFRHIDTAKAAQTTIFGKILWLSVTVVVILTEPMRQSGASNNRFIELLTRLRVGQCSQEDFDLLNQRRLSEMNIDWSNPNWRDAPIIVATNAMKDALNERATKAFAARTGRALHWYYAVDKRRGKAVTDVALRDHMIGLESGKTNQRLGRIPMVIGMPVMIMQNFDVPSGVVNGCKGTLTKIRYRIDNDGRRHAISCVIRAPQTSFQTPLPFLADKELVVALEDTNSMSFVYKPSGKRCTFQRTQLPIAPAFAMTAHKAQGQTLDYVIADLQSCRGTEPAYVMASRATSLDGLLILRDFSRSKIQSNRSGDARNEANRLELLRMKTNLEHGSADEKNYAKQFLSSMNTTNPLTIDPNIEFASSSSNMLQSLQSSWIEAHHTRLLSSRKRTADNLVRSLINTDITKFSNKCRHDHVKNGAVSTAPPKHSLHQTTSPRYLFCEKLQS